MIPEMPKILNSFLDKPIYSKCLELYMGVFFKPIIDFNICIIYLNNYGIYPCIC